MSSEKKMVDSATGASPPKFHTRDIGCSPIHFRSSIQSRIGSTGSFDPSPILLNQEGQNIKKNIVMTKVVDNEQTSLSLPSSCSNSSNTTPVLSSFSTTRPVSLMSLEVNDNYGFHTTQKSSLTTNDNHRWWPVDRYYRFRRDNKYRQRGRHVRSDLTKQGGDYCERSPQIRLGKLIIC
ncbi:unnamed protein product [Rotaria sp. Silwood1]|nr:unnamed protein product [Rotaria sp. Silwood1]CAF3851036.1 unnamed protein product [Rotaria sp. Silwood1]CAF4901781.1 unnamed protein product [Rotaria sp. Silwood1]CAF4905659.1 unnamed protein product [Rotaria sp. Silwood1]